MTWDSLGISALYTILMTVLSTIAAYVVGLPLGVLLFASSKEGLLGPKWRWFNHILGFFINIMRSIPCIIIVVLCMPATRAIFGTGIGKWYVMLPPLFVTSFAYVARVVEQSLREVPTGEIEAVKAMGATNWQIIVKVLLAESKPALLAGLVVTMVSLLGYTSFAWNVGAGGLIADIYSYYSKNTVDFMSSGQFWLMIVLVIIIVQGIQELGLYIVKRTDRRKRL